MDGRFSGSGEAGPFGPARGRPRGRIRGTQHGRGGHLKRAPFNASSVRFWPELGPETPKNRCFPRKREETWTRPGLVRGKEFIPRNGPKLSGLLFSAFFPGETHASTDTHPRQRARRAGQTRFQESALAVGFFRRGVQAFSLFRVAFVPLPLPCLGTAASALPQTSRQPFHHWDTSFAHPHVALLLHVLARVHALSMLRSRALSLSPLALSLSLSLSLSHVFLSVTCTSPVLSLRMRRRDALVGRPRARQGAWALAATSEMRAKGCACHLPSASVFSLSILP